MNRDDVRASLQAESVCVTLDLTAVDPRIPSIIRGDFEGARGIAHFSPTGPIIQVAVAAAERQETVNSLQGESPGQRLLLVEKKERKLGHGLGSIRLSAPGSDRRHHMSLSSSTPLQHYPEAELPHPVCLKRYGKLLRTSWGRITDGACSGIET